MKYACNLLQVIGQSRVENEYYATSVESCSEPHTHKQQTDVQLLHQPHWEQPPQYLTRLEELTKHRAKGKHGQGGTFADRRHRLQRVHMAWCPDKKGAQTDRHLPQQLGGTNRNKSVLNNRKKVARSLSKATSP